MYQPPLFHEERIDVMHDLMRAHPFATLVTSQGGGLAADHLPLVVHPELSDRGTLRGHIARGNPLWQGHVERGGKAGEVAGAVLAVFQGPQAYITPSWYPSKKAHGKVVPSWNYAVVQAHGSLRFHQESDWLLGHLEELTRRNEGHRPVPWEVSDAPRDFIDRQLKGIVGIEIMVERLDGKWKVSQNRTDEDRRGVERGLLLEPGENAAAMSELVARYGS